MKQMGLTTGSKSATTPATRQKIGALTDDEKELAPNQATIFRGIVARGNYLSQDRSDIRSAVKESSRRMSKTRVKDVNAARSLARYLSTRMRVICHFKKQKNWLKRWEDGVIPTGQDVLKLGKARAEVYSDSERTP